MYSIKIVKKLFLVFTLSLILGIKISKEFKTRKAKVIYNISIIVFNSSYASLCFSWFILILLVFSLPENTQRFQVISRIYLANFSQKIITFLKSRRKGGHIINFRDGEGRCGRYCLLLEISQGAIPREFESRRLRQRITVILIQRNDGYFMLKITNWGTFRERNSPIDRTSLFQIVKRQVIVKMLA